MKEAERKTSGYFMVTPPKRELTKELPFEYISKVTILLFKMQLHHTSMLNLHICTLNHIGWVVLYDNVFKPLTNSTIQELFISVAGVENAREYYDVYIKKIRTFLNDWVLYGNDPEYKVNISEPKVIVKSDDDLYYIIKHEKNSSFIVGIPVSKPKVSYQLDIFESYYFNYKFLALDIYYEIHGNTSDEEMCKLIKDTHQHLPEERCIEMLRMLRLLDK